MTIIDAQWDYGIETWLCKYFGSSHGSDAKYRITRTFHKEESDAIFGYLRVEFLHEQDAIFFMLRWA